MEVEAGKHFRNKNPGSETEISSHTRGTLEDNRGTIGPKKHPKFHENTDLVRKFNLGTNYYTTDNTLLAKAPLQMAAWVVWATEYGDSPGWTLTHKSLIKELESPRPVLWKGNN